MFSNGYISQNAGFWGTLNWRPSLIQFLHFMLAFASPSFHPELFSTLQLWRNQALPALSVVIFATFLSSVDFSVLYSCSFERTETSTMFYKTTTALMNHCHPPGKHINFKEKEWDKPLEIEEFMEHVLDEHKVSSKSWPLIDPVANHLIISSPSHHLIVIQVTLNGSLLLAIALLTEEERKQLIIIVKPRQVYTD